MIWTPDNVRTELAEAYRVLFTLPVKGLRPSTRSTWWPKTSHEADEVEEMRHRALRDGVSHRVELNPRKIGQMETILLGDGERAGWLVEYMSDVPALKRVLESEALWKAAGVPLKVGCRRKSWAYSTFRQKRDQAAALLAERLNKAIDHPKRSRQLAA